MGTQIEIDAGRLNSDKNAVTSELEQVRSELNLLQSEVTALNRSWRGTASEAYQARMAEDLESAIGVCTYLEEYVACMGEAVSAYSSCERSMEEIVSAIRI